MLATLAILRPAAPASANFGYVAVAAGELHTCGLTSADGVRCWGNNQYGQLGDGTSGAYDYNRPTPGDVIGLTSGVAAISAGFNFTCALLEGSGLKCWGQNGGGQLGDGTFIDRPTPVDVLGLTSGVTAVAAGAGASACALLDDTTVQCWGNNYLGQLGNGTASNEDPPNIYISVPAPVCADALCTGPLSGVVALALGSGDSCALVEDDVQTPGYGVKCWGSLFYGEVANPGPDLQCGNLSGNYCATTPKDILAFPSGVTAIAVASSHKCVLTADGGVKCWGGNFSGQLGNSTGNLVELTPLDVIGLATGVTRIAAGLATTCAITNTGALKCWGGPILGHGDELASVHPVDVCADAACSGTFSDAIDVSVGSYFHTCAVTTAGFVKCWGYNLRGELGNGAVGSFLTPTLTPTDLRQDSDGDGCIDVREVQTAPDSQRTGGLRNPKDPWDYFNPTGDGRNRVDDILAEVQHFGSTVGDPGYDTKYDRTYTGPYMWISGPPDGSVMVADILAVIRQFGHDCA